MTFNTNTKKQFELPTCCPAHVSSPGRGLEEAANTCCTKNKYKTMMRPVTNIARIANADQVPICLLVSTSVY